MDIQSRFWKKVTHSDDGCWEWTATKINTGYGHFRVGNRLVLAHRAAWELAIGPIPEGMVIDHICSNRACVRLDHLRVVTPTENAQRGDDHYNKRKGFCKQGHELTPENTGSYRTSRYCKTCRREWSKGYRKASRESRLPTPRATA